MNFHTIFFIFLYFKPQSLTAFNVRVQEEKIENSIVSNINYIEININKMSLRFLKFNSSTFNSFSVKNSDGLYTVESPPYLIKDQSKINIKIAAQQSHLILDTIFGLRIIWDGNSIAKFYLSKDYSNQICGLCGDANSNLIFTLNFGDLIYKTCH